MDNTQLAITIENMKKSNANQRQGIDDMDAFLTACSLLLNEGFKNTQDEIQIGIDKGIVDYKATTDETIASLTSEKEMLSAQVAELTPKKEPIEPPTIDPENPIDEPIIGR